MILADVARFDEFAESLGNRYLAVKVIARWARDLGMKFNEYHISESKLIEIILNGKYYSEAEMAQRRDAFKCDNIDDFLEWVIDDRIVKEVKHLYKKSICNKKLELCTNPDFSSGEVAKINILIKLIMYSTDD